jgi:DNA polymerase III delta prime subunit
MKKFDKTDMWPFKYSPKTLDEMVVSDEMKEKLKKVIDEKPNILLVGPAGVGKGTFTDIFLRETKLDYIKINCSDQTSVDNVRENVKSFATALGISPLKVVVMNEMDYLSLNAQAMLRALMEDVQKMTRFIFMCNYGNKLMIELISRCQVIELGTPPAKKIFEFVTDILNKENVDVKNKKVIVDIIKKLYPDIRSIVNTLQYNTMNKVLDSVVIEKSNEVYKNIFDKMKIGDIDGIRKDLRSFSINYPELYQYLFDNVEGSKSPGDFIIAIGEALYRDAIVAIKEINFISFIVKCMKQGIL